MQYLSYYHTLIIAATGIALNLQPASTRDIDGFQVVRPILIFEPFFILSIYVYVKL